MFLPLATLAIVTPVIIAGVVIAASVVVVVPIIVTIPRGRRLRKCDR
jgi:hypothetical protein